MTDTIARGIAIERDKETEDFKFILPYVSAAYEARPSLFQTLPLCDHPGLPPVTLFLKFSPAPQARTKSPSTTDLAVGTTEIVNRNV